MCVVRLTCEFIIFSGLFEKALELLAKKQDQLEYVESICVTVTFHPTWHLLTRILALWWKTSNPCQRR